MKKLTIFILGFCLSVGSLLAGEGKSTNSSKGMPPEQLKTVLKGIDGILGKSTTTSPTTTSPTTTSPKLNSPKEIEQSLDKLPKEQQTKVNNFLSAADALNTASNPNSTNRVNQNLENNDGFIELGPESVQNLDDKGKSGMTKVKKASDVMTTDQMNNRIDILANTVQTQGQLDKFTKNTSDTQNELDKFSETARSKMPGISVPNLKEGLPAGSEQIIKDLPPRIQARVDNFLTDSDNFETDPQTPISQSKKNFRNNIKEEADGWNQQTDEQAKQDASDAAIDSVNKTQNPTSGRNQRARNYRNQVQKDLEAENDKALEAMEQSEKPSENFATQQENKRQQLIQDLYGKQSMQPDQNLNESFFSATDQSDADTASTNDTDDTDSNVIQLKPGDNSDILADEQTNNNEAKYQDSSDSADYYNNYALEFNYDF